MDEKWDWDDLVSVSAGIEEHGYDLAQAAGYLEDLLEERWPSTSASLRGHFEAYAVRRLLEALSGVLHRVRVEHAREDNGNDDSPYFGGCPRCGETDGYVNIGRGHWFMCHAHRVRWFVGSNLFSSWREESEADWRRNADTIAAYQDVAPARRPGEVAARVGLSGEVCR